MNKEKWVDILICALIVMVILILASCLVYVVYNVIPDDKKWIFWLWLLK